MGTGRVDAFWEDPEKVEEFARKPPDHRLVALLEPAVILFMGLVVGYIVLSVLMAILSVNRVVA